MQRSIATSRTQAQARTAIRGSLVRTLRTTSSLLQSKTSNPDTQKSAQSHPASTVSENPSTSHKRKKTIQELDEEMRNAMAGIEGDGGLAGAELEGGKAVSMKRGVRENMFRYI